MNDYIIVMDKFGGAHLEHKQHKYIKREWTGKGWRYFYDTAITGKQYKNDANSNRRMANYYGDRANMYTQLAKGQEKIKGITYTDYENNPKGTQVDHNFSSKEREKYLNKTLGRYKREQHDSLVAEKNALARASAYDKKYSKSLAGRIETGKKIIDSLLSKLKKNVSTAYDKATDKVVSKAFDTAEKLSSKIVKEARKRGYGQQIETRTDISTGQKWKRVHGGPWEKVK